MDLLFKFGQAVSEIFAFQCSKKGSFCGQELKENFIRGVAPKTEFLMVFFCSFLGINPHNFVIKSSNFQKQRLILCKILLSFTGNFLHVAKKQPLGSRSQPWANWGQNTYKAISPEPCIQFLQTRPHFMQNFKLNKMFYLNIRIYLQLGVWGLKTSFWSIGPKRLTKQ